MARYKALHESYGFMGKHWTVGRVSSDTDLKPPVSKILGPLFEKLSDEENLFIEDDLAKAGPGAVESVAMSQMTESFVESKKSKTGMNHKK